jgi:hypothetical protein
MRRIPAAVACVLVAGCGGGGDAKPAAPASAATQPPPSSAEVSLRGPDTRRITFGHPLELRGFVRQSHPRGPLTVQLLASEYPYPVSEPIQSARTGEGGSFSFTVRPRLNTLYSVQVGNRVSRHIQVYAMPQGNFRVEPFDARRALFVYEITYPRGVVPTNRPIQFYAHLTGQGERFTRIGEARFERVTPERAVARVAIRLRRAADNFVACSPAVIAEGFGDPPIRDCGRRRVHVPPPH